MMMRYQDIRNINVSDYIEKKNGLNYLSWSWALDQLLLLDENASWEYLEPQYFNDTMMVFCRVHAFGKSRTAQLPVMDYLNQPITNPNAFQVNTAMQRCLAKAISLHGIGLYLYSGEDLPISNRISPPNQKIAPTAGAMDQFSLEERELLHGIAEEISQLIHTDKSVEAKSYFESLNREEKIAVWSLLNSKIRKSIKNL
jgi:hypothetical protein